MRMVDDMVLLQLNEPKAAGKLVVPKGVQTSADSLSCKVVAVGPGRCFDTGIRNTLGVKIGDDVIIKPDPMTTCKFRVEGKEYFSVDHMYIVAILDKGEDADVFQ